MDEVKCVGGGQCVAVAAEVFDQNEDDGIVILLDATPQDPAIQDAVKQAAILCPAAAIHHEE